MMNRKLFSKSVCCWCGLLVVRCVCSEEIKRLKSELSEAERRSHHVAPRDKAPRTPTVTRQPSSRHADDDDDDVLTLLLSFYFVMPPPP